MSIGIASSWGFLLGFRFSDRIGKGIRTSPRDAMICDLAPENRRGYAFGFQRAMDHTGAVIGPQPFLHHLFLVLSGKRLDLRQPL